MNEQHQKSKPMKKSKKSSEELAMDVFREYGENASDSILAHVSRKHGAKPKILADRYKNIVRMYRIFGDEYFNG